MYITYVFLFVCDNVVYVLSRFMAVGCGWHGQVLGPAVLYLGSFSAFSSTLLRK